MPDTNRFLKSEYMDGKSEDISDGAEEDTGIKEEEIEFLEARLRRQGEIDAEDRSSCEEALKIAKENHLLSDPAFFLTLSPAPEGAF